MKFTESPTNTGHGHVRPRADGVKARCGGPALCKECAQDEAERRWNENGACAPQCYAECDGACAAAIIPNYMTNAGDARCPYCETYARNCPNCPQERLEALAPAAPTNPWIQTLPVRGERIGVAFDLVSPTPAMVDFNTIATVLARVPRFGGHTGGGVLSVAQHCEQGARAILRETGNQLHAAAFLLHDAHEAYTGDIATPVAKAIGMHASRASTNMRIEAGVIVSCAIASLKSTLDAAIYSAAGMPWPLVAGAAEAVKEMDRRMLEMERRARLATPPHDWKDTVQPVEGADLFPWSEGIARTMYVTAVRELISPNLC